MAPPTKVNAEQKALLESLIDSFLENQKRGVLYKFWPALYRQWFEKYEIAEDISIEDVEERRRDLAAKLEKKKDYLRRWFHNHATPKVRSHAPVPVVAVTFKKPTRRPQLVQLYCKKYYTSRIKPLIVRALNGRTPTKKEFFILLRFYSTAALEGETPAVKAQMNEEYEKRLSEPVEEQEEEVTPKSYAAAIKSIPIQFNAFAREMEARTGWSFTLFAGGPDPTNGGRINTAAYHSCENLAGLSFADATPNFTSNLVTPFATFLRTVYTPEDCASRGLQPLSQLPRPTEPRSEHGSPAEKPLPTTSSDLASVGTGTMTLALGGEIDPASDMWQDFDPEQALAELYQNSTIPMTFNGIEDLGLPGQLSSMIDELYAPLSQGAYWPPAPLNPTPSTADTTENAPLAPLPHAAIPIGTKNAQEGEGDDGATPCQTSSAAIQLASAIITVGAPTAATTTSGPIKNGETTTDEPTNAPNVTPGPIESGEAPTDEPTNAPIVMSQPIESRDTTTDEPTTNRKADGATKRKRAPKAGEDPNAIINTKRTRKPATSKEVEAPTSNTSAPQKRKRAPKAGEDPELIVSTKRVRKPAPSKELETVMKNNNV